MPEPRQATFAGISGTLTYKTVKSETPVPEHIRNKVAQFALSVVKNRAETETGALVPTN